MKKYLQKLFIKYLVHNLYNSIDVDDILQFTKKNGIMYRGVELTKEEVEALKEEATRFQKSVLWKLIHRQLKWTANERMLLHAKNDEDLFFGRAMIYNIQLIEDFIESLK